MPRPVCCFRMGCRLFLLFILLWAGAARPGAAQSGPSPAFNPANGHWYLLVRTPGPLNWPQARAAAEAMFFAGYRGHLATVTSAEENQFVSAYLTANGGVSDLWLGGYQDTSAPDYQEPAGGWRWVTGEPWAYTSWSGGEPNHAGGAENVLEANSGGTWNDLPEGAGLVFHLVEFEAPPVPGAPRLGILPNPAIGGQTTVGQVTLDRPAAPDDVVVTLASSDPAVAAVPAVVIVPAGVSTALFSIVTFPVSTPTAVALVASGPGGSRAAALQVLPVGTLFPPGNLLLNGGFEQPGVPPGMPSLILRGGSELPGWRITQGSVEVALAPTWQAAPGEGSQSLDLVGEGAGRIEQEFATMPGQEYRFSGWMAHHPGNPVAPEGRSNVFLNGQFFVQLFHRDVASTPAAMGWTRFAYRFRAADTVTRLAIADVTGTWPQGGLVLDGLAVMPIPPNLLINGSFEEPDVSGSADGHRFLGPGELPGWRFDRGTVSVVHERTWQPAQGQGSQLLHLRGRADAAGTVEQSFRTEPGRRYVLSGWVSHHPALREGRANVFINGDLLTQLYHSTALYGPQTPAELRWQPFSYTFRALEATTSLRFLDVTGLSEAEGILLDGLIVTPSAEPMPGLPPAAPTGLTAQLVSPGQVNLTWLDNSSDETGFEIQRRAGAGVWTRIALVAPNVTRFGDLGVTPGVTYTYRVRAMNESGDSVWSNEASVTTPGRP